MREHEISTQEIVDGHELCFDPGDRRNASLYLAVPRAGAGAGDARLDAIIEAMRSAALWSGVAPKWVAEADRKSYREQLRLVDLAHYRLGGIDLLAVRFDHPKFPSDDERWPAWRHFLGEATAGVRASTSATPSGDSPR